MQMINSVKAAEKQNMINSATYSKENDKTLPLGKDESLNNNSAKDKTDIFNITDSNKVMLKIEEIEEKKPSKLEQLQQAKAQLDNYIQQWENSKEQSKSLADEYKKKIKCFKIAMSIMAGDKVPAKDKQFLQKNEPEMYKTAILLAKRKEKPKDNKSVLDDDDKKSINSTEDFKKALGQDNVTADGVMSAISEL